MGSLPESITNECNFYNKVITKPCQIANKKNQKYDKLTQPADSVTVKMILCSYSKAFCL